MGYVGIDYHKRYSVLCATDERGQELKQRRINGNSASGFAQFFCKLAEQSKVVMEACWNWGWLYDLLGEIDLINEVVLAHPYKTGVAPFNRDSGKLRGKRMIFGGRRPVRKNPI